MSSIEDEMYMTKTGYNIFSCVHCTVSEKFVLVAFKNNTPKNNFRMFRGQKYSEYFL